VSIEKICDNAVNPVKF